MSGGLKKFSEDAKELASDSTALAKRLADKTKELGSGTFAIRMGKHAAAADTHGDIDGD